MALEDLEKHVVLLMDAETRKLYELPAHAGPDGRFFAVFADGRSVSLFDLEEPSENSNSYYPKPDPYFGCFLVGSQAHREARENAKKFVGERRWYVRSGECIEGLKTTGNDK